MPAAPKVTLQDERWRQHSPSSLNDRAWFDLYGSAEAAARAGRHQQDILEEFKWCFSERAWKKRSCAKDAETDLYRLMREAARNAPVFIAHFAEACSAVREQGYHAPTIRDINEILSRAGAGFQIERDTVVRRDWIANAEYAAWEQTPADAPEVRRPLTTSDKPQARSGAPPSRPPSRKRSLRVFLCHSSRDKPFVKELCRDLKAAGYKPWLGVDNLIPGQGWEDAIKKAVRESHVVIVCLSADAVTKAGFIQKEIKFALDVADEQPEGRIFIIPARLEDCEVPNRLSKWHWVNLFEPEGYHNLLSALVTRASDL
jgi:TIR domain-containing protein